MMVAPTQAMKIEGEADWVGATRVLIKFYLIFLLYIYSLWDSQGKYCWALFYNRETEKKSD